MNSILGLVSAISAVTFIVLGIVLSVLWGTMGLIFVGVGVIDAIVAAVVFARRRDQGETGPSL